MHFASALTWQFLDPRDTHALHAVAWIAHTAVPDDTPAAESPASVRAFGSTGFLAPNIISGHMGLPDPQRPHRIPGHGVVEPLGSAVVHTRPRRGPSLRLGLRLRCDIRERSKALEPPPTCGVGQLHYCDAISASSRLAEVNACGSSACLIPLPRTTGSTAARATSALLAYDSNLTQRIGTARFALPNQCCGLSPGEHQLRACN